MKHFIALLPAFASLFGVGKCGGPQKEGEAETFTITSPTSMTHSSGMRYLKK